MIVAFSRQNPGRQHQTLFRVDCLLVDILDEVSIRMASACPLTVKLGGVGRANLTSFGLVVRMFVMMG